MLCDFCHSDDMRSQGAVIKRSESGASGQSVPSAILLPHCATGSERRSLSTKGQQLKTHCLHPRRRVLIFFLMYKINK